MAQDAHRALQPALEAVPGSSDNVKAGGTRNEKLPSLPHAEIAAVDRPGWLARFFAGRTLVGCPTRRAGVPPPEHQQVRRRPRQVRQVSQPALSHKVEVGRRSRGMGLATVAGVLTAIALAIGGNDPGPPPGAFKHVASAERRRVDTVSV